MRESVSQFMTETSSFRLAQTGSDLGRFV